MKYIKFVILLIIALLLSGCIDPLERFEKVQVVYVNVSVAEEDNQTLIKSIQAHGGEVSKLKRPGMVLPQKFPGIYVEILQEFNVSHPNSPLDGISLPNGQEYKGPGNYSFMVQLVDNALNKSHPINVYAEIQKNGSYRLTRQSVWVNWTE